METKCVYLYQYKTWRSSCMALSSSTEAGAICLTHAIELAENSVIWGRKFGLYRNSFEEKGASPNFAV